jgi:hypothetical protein
VHISELRLLDRRLQPRVASYMRRWFALVSSLTLIAGIWFIGTNVSANTIYTESLVIKNNAFIRHNFVEVGSRPNGSFGSESTVGEDFPSGWHFVKRGNLDQANFDRNKRIGFLADRTGNGFGITEGQVEDGDFFLAGMPYEGWSLQVGSNSAKWNHDGAGGLFPPTTIAGSFATPTDPNLAEVTWNSSTDTNGVAVSQTYKLPSDGTHTLTMAVALTNNNATETDVYYARAVDPDNCRDQALATCDTRSGLTDDKKYYETYNKITHQTQDGDAVTSVMATQKDNSVLHLWTNEVDSAALFGADIDTEYCQSTTSLAPMYNAQRTFDFSNRLVLNIGAYGAPYDRCTLTNKAGAEGFADEIIYLIIKKTIPSGETATFDLHYSLSASAFATSMPINLGLVFDGTQTTIASGSSTTIAATGSLCALGQTTCFDVPAFKVAGELSQSAPGMVRAVVDGIPGEWIPITYTINADGTTTANFDTGALSNTTSFEFIAGTYVSGAYQPIQMCLDNQGTTCVLSTDSPSTVLITVTSSGTPDNNVESSPAPENNSDSSTSSTSPSSKIPVNNSADNTGNLSSLPETGAHDILLWTIASTLLVCLGGYLLVQADRDSVVSAKSN